MENSEKIKMKIDGMTCAHCENKVGQALGDVFGVLKVFDINWKSGSAIAEVKKGLPHQSLIRAIEKLGYTAQIHTDSQTQTSAQEDSYNSELDQKAFSKQKHEKDFDLLILGSGSASFAAAIKASELGKTVAIIEEKTMGGTCVNVGCVPSKALIRAAEAKHRIENSAFKGIGPGSSQVDFSRLIKEKDDLVSSLRGAKYASVLKANPNISWIPGRGQFVDSQTIQVNERKITAEKILIATGSSPFIPEIPGLKDSGYLTSTTAFELKTLPEKLIVMGGGYIALELAQMFSRLGSKVTIIQRSEILFNEDREISEGLCHYLKSEGVEILNHTQVKSVQRTSGKLNIEILRQGESMTLNADEIVVATGRRPNSQGLNLEAVGVEINPNGSIKVNSNLQTSQPNIYAAGDVLESPALVYVAAYEGNLAAENAFLGNKKNADYGTVPWVIFSDPQVSGVGLNEAQAKTQGVEYDVSLLSLEHVPRAIAARDTRGFVKLLRKTGTDELIGARVLAPEGSELIMELSLILKYKIPLSEVAGMFHPYLTLSEAIKLAAQTFDKDISKLSCCAG